MNKKILTLIVLVVVVATVALIISLGDNEVFETTSLPAPITNPVPEATDLPPIAVNPPAVEAQNVVVYTDSGFSPTTLNVKRGETVTFENRSSLNMWPASALHPTHAVYDGTSLQEHCPNNANTAFDACEGIPPGSSWSFQFNRSGTWKYHDHLSPRYTGTIIVE